MTLVARPSGPSSTEGPLPAARSVVFVGGGPRALSVLERLGASAPELLGDVPVTVHVVDPHPVGAGRIWRQAQSPLLWMNSVAADITVFTDDSVTCEGPVVPGPSLSEWVFGEGRERLSREGLDEHVALLRGPDGFATRAVQGEYLAWAFERVVRSLPVRVEVVWHRGVAVDVADSAAGRQSVTVEQADGTQTVLDADVVVLAQGHLEHAPTVAGRELAAAARAHGLTHIGPGYTADVDLGDIRPGEPVIVSGFGLAFVDLMVLLGEGRGGRFREARDGSLAYEPSGSEPVLHVGSRRGVPYHSKLGYVVPGQSPVPPRHLTRDALDRLAQAHPEGLVDWDAQLRPLIEKELAHAHYERLFAAHPSRVDGDWSALELLLAETAADDPAFTAAIATAVPDPADRFVIADIDRPLRRDAFPDADALSARLVALVEADLERRGNPEHSADLAVFNRLLTVVAVLAELIAAGRLSASDRIDRFEGWFTGFFSFLASGPPPRRLHELLALHRAGLLQFLGPDVSVRLDAPSRGVAAFVASSPAVPGETRARVYVEARLPRMDVLATSDPVVRAMLGRGELAVETLASQDGAPVSGGRLLTDVARRALRSDGTAHPARFLLGPAVAGSAGSGGFARPGFNGPGFRENDAVARAILRLLTAEASAALASASPVTRERTTT